MRYEFTTIKVRDMEESIKFYTDVLKLREYARLSSMPGVNIVFLKDSSGNRIELIKTDDDTDIATGRVSIGFVADNLEDVIRFIKEHGLTVKRGPIETSTGERFLIISDPNGVEIEFIQNFKF